MTIKSLQKELAQCQSDRQREHDLRCRLAGENEAMRNVVKQLTRVLDAYEGKQELHSNQGQALDGYSALAEFVAIAEGVRSILPPNK